MSEVSLYPAVKRFLEAAGFDVKGEVKGCDIVAVRLDEPLTLTIVEMKLGFSLELLLQATDRMRAADAVWLAVPATRRGRDRDPRVHVFAGCSASACWPSTPRGIASRFLPSQHRISRDRICVAAGGCSANMREGGATHRPAAPHARR